MDREEDGRHLSHRSPLSLLATETMESAIHRDQITHSSCVERVWGGGQGPGAAKLCDLGQVTHLWASVFLSGV